MSPKIFISHSAKDDRTQKVLWDLYDYLVDDGFEPLLDLARLKESVGNPWRTTLNTWMEICDGAIVVVNESARKNSEWVPHEVSILSWRQERDPGFVLIPTVLNPVLPNDLGKKPFKAQNLAALQAAAISLDDQSEYLDTVRNRLAPLKAREVADTPMGRIEQRLASLLNVGNVDEDSIKRAAKKLGEDFDRWNPNLPLPNALARFLLKTDLPRACRALRELTALNADQQHKILDLIAPSWVDLRAVRPIRDISTGSADERCLAVNGSEIVTLEMYLLRASGFPRNGGWPFIEITSDTSERVADRLVEQIIKSFILKTSLKRSFVERRLKIPGNGTRDPVFLLFPKPEPDEELLLELQSKFQAVNFFVLSGNEVPTSTVSEKSGAHYLEPPLQPGDEQTAIDHYIEARFQFSTKQRQGER